MSRNVLASSRRAGVRTIERARGVPASLMRFTAGRKIEISCENPSVLPVIGGNTALQDSSGAFLNLPGYSKAGGPDIGS